jgi:hypothetical protein
LIVKFELIIILLDFYAFNFDSSGAAARGGSPGSLSPAEATARRAGNPSKAAGRQEWDRKGENDLL